MSYVAQENVALCESMGCDATLMQWDYGMM